MNFLTPQELTALETAIYNTIGYAATLRRLMLSNVNSQFKAFLAIDPIESFQLGLDLIELNRTERLTDGTIPFEGWLEKASQYAGQHPVANDLIQKALGKINARTASVPVDNPTPPNQAEIDTIVKERSVHKNDMVSYAFLEAGFKAGNSVARIIVPRYENGIAKKLNGEPAIYLGTGWLLTKDLIITNHHVINARENNEPNASKLDLEAQAQNTEVQFDFNDDKMPGVKSTVTKLEASDPVLDYAIIRLKAPVDRQPLSMWPQEVIIPPGETPVVNIIQHPFGNSKKVALRNNHIYNVKAPNVRYFTDTEGGTSGSPVFNDTWQVIAMHKASILVNNVSYNGKATAWVNEGIQLKAIMADLQTNFNALANEIANLGNMGV